jgi:hypothetical protein
VLRFFLLTLLFIFIARAFWQVVGGMIEASSGTPARTGRKAQAVKLVKDPVCGTFVSSAGRSSIGDSPAPAVRPCDGWGRVSL